MAKCICIFYIFLKKMLLNTKTTVGLLLVILFASCGAPNPEDEIMDRLAFQTECWNSGEIDCFMIGYWESDSLMFIGTEGIIYGFENTLKRYYTKYPDEESMGQLRFNIQHINKVSEDAYFVVGRYHLTRSIGNVEGAFTLLWRKINGQWVIVADHSS